MIVTSFIQFLSQLFERRSKFIAEDEWALWQGVTQELMSDEEDQGNTLKVKSPGWRCAELDELIEELDKRSEDKASDESKQVLKKRRVVAESPMKRRPSKKLKASLINN